MLKITPTLRFIKNGIVFNICIFKKFINMKLSISFLLFVICINAYSQSSWIWQNPLPQGNNLKTVKFTSSNIGYACGFDGTIIKTTNRGVDWVLMRTNLDYEVNSLFFLNDNTGYAVESESIDYEVWGEGHLLKTSNGGSNWQIIYTITGCNLYNVEFSSLDTGYIVSRNSTLGMVFKTTNMGLNWIQQYVVSNGYFTCSYFIDNNTGFV